MDPQSPEFYELQYLSYSNWRLMIALGIGAIACLWRLNRRPREAWLVAGAILLVAFDEFGLHLLAMRTMRLFWAHAPGIPVEKSVAWFNFLCSPLYSVVAAAAWGLIFYAAFGEGSGAKPTYLNEDERSAKESI